MASRKFVFGNPPFKFLADHLARDEDFLTDVRRIVDLDKDAYLKLASQLAISDKFLSRSDLVELVANCLGDGFEAVARIIYRIGGIVHDAEMNAADSMDELARAIEGKDN